MTKLFDEAELEDRLDCFGEFDVSDEICLKYCGLNIACALSIMEEEDDLEEWLEGELLGIPDYDFD